MGLGVRQDGTALGDVALPPWAHGSAHEFVRLHRAALESDHVSARLHEWVDLVFGHKQRGKAAVAALNVFYYLTYEGEVDLDKICDEHERAATEAQIVNFGNTPTQLIADKPAAPRGDGPHNAAAERTTPPDERRERAPSLSLSPQTAQHHLHVKLSDAPILCLRAGADRVHAAAANRRVSSHAWEPHRPPLKGAPPLGFDASADAKPFGVPFAGSLPEPPRGGRCAVSADGRWLFSAGYWDRSLRCSHVSTGNTAQRLRAHADVVTCVALSEDGHTLVTGSRDTTLMVWALHDDGGGGGGGGMGFGLGVGGTPTTASGEQSPRTAAAAAGPLPDKPRHVLHGHDDGVLCVAASAALDTALSGSADGTAIVFSLKGGQYVRTIAHPAGGGGSTAVDLVALGGAGVVVLYSLSDLTLHATTINHRAGEKPLASADACERLSALVLSGGGDALFTAGDSGAVAVRRPSDLGLVHRLLPSTMAGGNAPLRCLALTPDEQFVAAGSSRGTISVWGAPSSAIARAALDQLGRTVTAELF